MASELLLNKLPCSCKAWWASDNNDFLFFLAHFLLIGNQNKVSYLANYIYRYGRIKLSPGFIYPDANIAFVILTLTFFESDDDA